MENVLEHFFISYKLISVKNFKAIILLFKLITRRGQELLGKGKADAKSNISVVCRESPGNIGLLIHNPVKEEP